MVKSRGSFTEMRIAEAHYDELTVASLGQIGKLEVVYIIDCSPAGHKDLSVVLEVLIAPKLRGSIFQHLEICLE
jgi:hypothetical protein